MPADPAPDGGDVPVTAADRAPSADRLVDRIERFLHAFVDMLRLPRAFWIVNIVYAIDGFAYFGVLLLLPPFLTDVAGVPDKWATVVTACFSAAVTLFMFGFGSYAERFGVRRALLAGMLIITAGRLLLCGSPSAAGMWGTVGAAIIVVASAALLVTAIGEGVLQTANYSGLKQYSDEKTSAMSFGFNYALFNLGIVAVGFASPPIRVGVNEAIAARSAGEAGPSGLIGWLASFCGSGIEAVFWMCAAATTIGVLVCLALTPRAEAQKLRPEDETRIAKHREADARGGILGRIKSGPFGDLRFTAFVFILFPARTMFAYQIHIMTNYVLRAYPKEVGDRAEWFGNGVNPLIIVLGVPIITAMTRRMNMYRMMIIGTWVTVLPTFLLCLGERWELLLTYMILFSIGEALWQPRLYQFAAELAPEGRIAAYTAAANVPWLLAKFVTGWYAGWMMSIYCPAEGPRNPGVMWFIYGAIGLISPIGLMVLAPWFKAGLHRRQPAPAV